MPHCRHTLLPFDPAGWTPRSHRRYPPALQAAVRVVLLAAQRGTQRRAQLLASCCLMLINMS